MSRILRLGGAAAAVLFVAFWAGSALADRISDIRNTRHNFSATVIPSLPEGDTRNAEATSESQICAFCHTPHGATVEPRAPIWNRQLSSASYIPYSSASIDATDLGQPGGKSKLCLSCHDGTLAMGSVNVLNRQENASIEMTGTAADGSIPGGLGETTGFTRRLGTDLTNDHPISFTYDRAQFLRDGELYDPELPSTAPHNRTVDNTHPTLPLEDNKVECITCHDPHIRDSSGENIKFLRVNRFQKLPPVDGAYDENGDIICLACHDKAGWVGSAHANMAVGDERYTADAAELREFPEGMQVWQAACLNCHDPHTVQGSRRLLREGVDGPTASHGSARFKLGGNPAIEETCYACHSPDGGTLQGQGSANFEVPDIKTDFTTMRIHMPISSHDQPAGEERHSIGTGLFDQQGGKDFIESQAMLGNVAAGGSPDNRHAECTDCHNPHRVTRNRLFNADNTVPDESGTHNHNAPHTNIASGVLRGIWGVEPIYTSTEFGVNPSGYEIKRGDPDKIGSGSTDVNEPYLTREYQVCLKCHSDYGFVGDKSPAIGENRGGTPFGTNSLEYYTNQAMEYNAPDSHKGEGTATGGGADGAYEINNHRSWHPVIEETGRTTDVRGIGSPNIWLPPFNGGVGTQTMYCTDCHGSDTAPGTAVPRGGEHGFAWGPHGSNNNFLLKGTWSDQTGQNNQADGLCFKCHDFDQYGRDFGGVTVSPDENQFNILDSGFKRGGGIGGLGCAVAVINPQVNLHVGHANRVNNFRCSFCHISIPHGWKNKVFLANLNDVGPETSRVDITGTGNEVRNNTEARYYDGPYYNGSVLKVRQFSTSGRWQPENCGSAGISGNGAVGQNWMAASSEACQTLP